MSTRAMLSSVAAGAAMLLTACAQQPPPSLPAAAPIQPVARRATPPQPRVRQAARTKPVQTGVAPDEGTQRDCAYQGLLAEDHAQDEDPSALGLNSVLAGQSLRDACLRASRRSARPLGEP